MREWIEKKFDNRKKLELMKSLWDGSWSRELVVNVVKSEVEVDIIKSQGIQVLRLTDIVRALHEEKFPVPSAAGADFIDLIHMTAPAVETVKSRATAAGV